MSETTREELEEFQRYIDPDANGLGLICRAVRDAMRTGEAEKAEAEAAKYLKLLQSFEAAVDLWLPRLTDAEHEHEARALHQLRDRLLTALHPTDTHVSAPINRGEGDRSLDSEGRCRRCGGTRRIGAGEAKTACPDCATDPAPADRHDDPVLIWSGEHRAYWRPCSAGYTHNPAEAGHYSREEGELVKSRCGPEKQIELYPLTDQATDTVPADHPYYDNPAVFDPYLAPSPAPADRPTIRDAEQKMRDWQDARPYGPPPAAPADRPEPSEALAQLVDAATDMGRVLDNDTAASLSGAIRQALSQPVPAVPAWTQQLPDKLRAIKRLNALDRYPALERLIGEVEEALPAASDPED